MDNYKKYECLMCGNVFPSKAKYKVYCVNGTKKGCRSTKVHLLEENKEIVEDDDNSNGGNSIW